MNKKYCLPIIRNNKNEVLETIHTNINDYGYFEVWLDYIDDLDNVFIKKLISLLGEKLILLFRRQNLEKINLDLEKRLKIISFLNGAGSFIDLDVFDQKVELDHIKNKRLEVKTIVSYHDYKETPENKKLKEIIDIMSKYKPTIYKIATMCNSLKDALRLLQLLLELKLKGLKYIVLGMSEFGYITRIFGPLWGNELIFAPHDSKEQSAQGQLTRKQLETIFKELKV
jgi:3-dehydroquinate dehydratase type I